MMLRFYYDLNLGLRAPDYFLKRDYSGAAYRKSLFFAFPSKVRASLKTDKSGETKFTLDVFLNNNNSNLQI